MQKWVDDRLCGNQAGFCEGRCCTDNIFSLKLLMEKCLEFQMHAIATFVVFRAAFLWRIMREYGIPEKLINFIRNTYRGCNARVRVGADAAD